MIIVLIFFFKFFFGQIDLVCLMGFFSLSKGATTSLKRIYKHCGQQYGVLFHFY
jgi:hypothetical protein